jgi:hypothetical protein
MSECDYGFFRSQIKANFAASLRSNFGASRAPFPLPGVAFEDSTIQTEVPGPLAIIMNAMVCEERLPHPQ